MCFIYKIEFFLFLLLLLSFKSFYPLSYSTNFIQLRGKLRPGFANVPFMRYLKYSTGLTVVYFNAGCLQGGGGGKQGW